MYTGVNGAVAILRRSELAQLGESGGASCLLASGGDDAKLRLWDLRAVPTSARSTSTSASASAIPRAAHTLSAHNAGVTALAWHPTHSHLLASGRCNINTPRLSEFQNSRFRFRFRTRLRRVLCIHDSPSTRPIQIYYSVNFFACPVIVATTQLRRAAPSVGRSTARLTDGARAARRRRVAHPLADRSESRE